MKYKLFVVLLLTSVLLSVTEGSGYFPKIGGPWSRYTTTTPRPDEGVNLPATESPPPPSVTFVPRPRPDPQQQEKVGAGGNNLEPERQNQPVGTQMPQSESEKNYFNKIINNFYIVMDPMTGERFLVPKQNFWNRFGNMEINSQGRISDYNSDQSNGQKFTSRSRRSTDEETLQNSEENEEVDTAVRHIDPLVSDESSEEPANNVENDLQPESDLNESDKSPLVSIVLIEERNLNNMVEHSPEDISDLNQFAKKNIDIEYLNDYSDSEEDNKSFEFNSSTDLFQMFFPNMNNKANKMIYTYAFYRPSISKRKTVPSKKPGQIGTVEVTTNPEPTIVTEKITPTSTETVTTASPTTLKLDSETTPTSLEVNIDDSPNTTTLMSENIENTETPITTTENYDPKIQLEESESPDPRK